MKMKIWKRVGCLALAAAAMFAVAGCGTGSQSAGSGKMQELSIGLMPDTDSLPFLIAEEKGYFADEGVKVNLKPFKSAMDRDSAMQSGHLDGAVSDMLAAAFAKDGGFDVKVTSSTDGSYKLIAGKAEPAADVKGLRGKDVSVSRNTIIEYVTDEILAKDGLKGDDINKVIIPQIPTRLEMLQNGKLAAATLPEPMASIAIYNGGRSSRAPMTSASTRASSSSRIRPPRTSRKRSRRCTAPTTVPSITSTMRRVRNTLTSSSRRPVSRLPPKRR